MAARIIISLIRLYQYSISPLLGNRCRFYPSCSQYTIICLNSYAFVEAIRKSSWRILRCHPLNPGGVDLP